MKKKNVSFGKYLSKEKEKKANIKFSALLNECCKDYSDSDDEDRLIMLKAIIMILIKLLYGEEHLVNIDIDQH